MRYENDYLYLTCAWVKQSLSGTQPFDIPTKKVGPRYGGKKVIAKRNAELINSKAFNFLFVCFEPRFIQPNFSVPNFSLVVFPNNRATDYAIHRKLIETCKHHSKRLW